MKNLKKYVCLLLAVTLSLALFTGCSDSSGSEDTDEFSFSYSDGIDDDGFWSGVKAQDHIVMFTYLGMEIPSDVHLISDADVTASVRCPAIAELF